MSELKLATRYRIGSAPDWRENQIGEGDTVLYPRHIGDSVEVREAVVLEIFRFVRDRAVYVQGKGVEMRPAYGYRLQPTGNASRRPDAAPPGKPVWITNGENVTRV